MRASSVDAVDAYVIRDKLKILLDTITAVIDYKLSHRQPRISFFPQAEKTQNLRDAQTALRIALDDIDSLLCANKTNSNNKYKFTTK